MMRLLLLSLSLMLGGCAFVDNRVVMKYEKPPTADTSAGVIGRVRLTPTKDSAGLARNSTGQLVVGHVRNGFGAKTADVLTDDSPTEWINQAMAEALRSRGYPADALAESDVVIDTELVELTNQTEVNFWTAGDQVTTRLKLTVRRGDLVVESSECIGRSDHRAGVLSERTKQAAYMESLEMTVKIAAEKVVAVLASGATASRPAGSRQTSTP